MSDQLLKLPATSISLTKPEQVQQRAAAIQNSLKDILKDV